MLTSLIINGSLLYLRNELGTRNLDTGDKEEVNCLTLRYRFSLELENLELENWVDKEEVNCLTLSDRFSSELIHGPP